MALKKRLPKLRDRKRPLGKGAWVEGVFPLLDDIQNEAKEDFPSGDGKNGEQ